MANPIEISAKIFLAKLRKNTLGTSNYIVTDKVEVSKEAISRIELDNIKFLEEVKFQNLKLEYGLFFENCEFIKGIFIDSVIANTYSQKVNKENCSILFSSCVSKFIAIRNQCELLRGVVVQNKCKIEHLSISETTVNQNSVRLKDSIISKVLEFSKVRSEINLNSLELQKLRIESCIGNISVLKSTFHDWVQLWNIECTTSLVFNYNIFEDTVKISGSRINQLSIIGDTFQKKITLENRDTNNSLSTHLKELFIREVTFKEIGEFDGLGKQINKLTIPNSPKLEGVLKIENWAVGELDIHGINQNLKLILSQLFVKRISMIGFTNYGDITFERCSADNINFKTELDSSSSIMLAHADLGKTKFIEFDFDSFDFVKVDNSSFNEIYTSNVVWFDENKLQIEDDKQDEFKIAKRTREVYRQLKQSLKNSGNQIDSLEFQAREMKAYRKELKLKGKDYKWSDRVIMSVNKSNDYGLN